ncbi:MAG TPA: serine/threonine-protein kinase [Polyangiaceae bacterium]
MLPTAPQVIGRYAIHEQIASGGMASVHFARLVGPAGSRRTVAVKRAHPHLARDNDFALMFLDEARLASRVVHPNVVPTVDVLQTDAELLLVMEYVHGESLWKLARGAHGRGERVPFGVAGAILVDTLRGLHAAHEARDERGAPLNLVHRDVSPHNILVGTDGVARLVDFGIAKAEGRLHSTRDSSVKGKFAYMAPEQARGEAVSRLSDTYAAAIVLWELLTGERLFAGKTEAETVHKCLVARVRRPSLLAPELGPEVDAILEKGLSRDPAGRYATADEMARDIEACIPAARPSEVGAWVQHIAGESLAERARVLATLEAAETSTLAPARPRGRALWVGAIAAALGIVSAVTLVARRVTSTPVTLAADPPVAIAASVAPPPAVSSAPAPAPSTAAPTATAAVVPALSTARFSKPPAAARVGRSGRSASCDPPYSIDSAGRQIFKPECLR